MEETENVLMDKTKEILDVRYQIIDSMRKGESFKKRRHLIEQYKQLKGDGEKW
jgi:hypothetical protein